MGHIPFYKFEMCTIIPIYGFSLLVVAVRRSVTDSVTCPRNVMALVKRILEVLRVLGLLSLCVGSGGVRCQVLLCMQVLPTSMLRVRKMYIWFTLCYCARNDWGSFWDRNATILFFSLGSCFILILLSFCLNLYLRSMLQS
jgi:hypothetical protein